MQELLSHKQMAYSTVITLLQRMEAKGLVDSRKGDVGKAFIFKPIVQREQVRRRAVESMMSQYFQNNPLKVFSTLLDAKKLRADEIEQMRALLDQLEQSKEDGGES